MQGDGEKAIVLPLPQSIRIERGGKWSFEKKVKCNMEASCESHICSRQLAFLPSQGQKESSKGTWKQHYLPRLFSSIKYCIPGLSKVRLVNTKHWSLPFSVLPANDSYFLFPLGFLKICTINPGHSFFWKVVSAPWRWAGSGKAYSIIPVPEKTR